MDTYYQDEQVTLHHGDAGTVLATLPDNSVDAVVTDPPYGLANTTPAQVAETLSQWTTGDRNYTPAGRGFMGQEWDAFVPPPAVWDECYRVLKPGGHLAVFAGSRTQDLMGISVRLAGFDVRDSVAWLYGSGFPKSLDVSKAIDKAARGYPQGTADPTSPNHGKYRTSKTEGKRWNGDSGQSYGAGGSAFLADTASGKTTANDTSTTAETSAVAVESDPKSTPAVIATDEAKKWEGWGTALKPAHEPILLARKPLEGTVAANVITWGTGAINIDATRIGNGSESKARVGEASQDDRYTTKGGTNFAAKPGARGGAPNGRFPANVVLDEHAARELDQQSGTTGGASRFFYVAKASKRERPNVDGVQHPTVKPLELMRWLVRLLTPPGGVVLDPFAGSGTTLCAAVDEGRHAIGVELEERYCEIIAKRLAQGALDLNF